jgi:Uma2 family endonuclease
LEELTMTIATQRFTFAEYLDHSDGTDTRYELVNGELIPMSLGMGLHGEIIDFTYRQLDAEISRTKPDWIVRPVAIGVRSPRAGRWDTSRIPDLTVIPREQWLDLRNREAVIELNQSPPLLVVEVVSDSTTTTDYRSKRAEYSVLNIPEYWILDPLTKRVTLCLLEDGLYESSVYMGQEPIESLLFPALQLTAMQLVNPLG